MSTFKYGGGWVGLVFFQRVLPTLSDVKDAGHRRWRSQETCLDGSRLERLLTLRLPLWISLPPPLVPSPCVSLAPVLTGFLISYVFSTCMPHYILKVNPINTEITLEDKLLRRGSFCVCVCVAWLPLHGAPPCFILHRQCLPPEILITTSYILTRLTLYLL